jgi:hypothetical protein
MVVVVCPWCDAPAEVHGSELHCEDCSLIEEIVGAPALEAVPLAA